MEDVFTLYENITSNEDCVECSGRSGFNLYNIPKLNCISDLNIPRFIDSIRFVTKRLFIGTLFNSYKFLKSHLIDSFTVCDVKGETETSLKYGIGGTELKNISNSSSDVTYNEALWQPYYSLNEIITNTNYILEDGCSNIITYRFNLFPDDTSLTFTYGMNSASFFTTLTEISSDYVNTTSLSNSIYIDCSKEAVDHLMFDYNDQIDAFKIHRVIDRGLNITGNKNSAGRENQIINYISTNLKFDTYGNSESYGIMSDNNFEPKGKVQIMFDYNYSKNKWYNRNAFDVTINKIDDTIVSNSTFTDSRTGTARDTYLTLLDGDEPKLYDGDSLIIQIVETAGYEQYFNEILNSSGINVDSV